jgi:hypothetical protein
VVLRTRWLAALSVALVVGLLAACGGEDENPTEAAAQLCDAMAALEVAVNNVAALNADSTIDDVEAAQDELVDAYQQVEDLAEDVEDMRIDELSPAYESLDQTLDGIDAGMSMSEVQAELQDEVAAVQAAWGQLFASVSCPAS